MKKILCLFLSLFLTCFVCACGQIPDSSTTSATDCTLSDAPDASSSAADSPTVSGSIGETVRLPLLAVSTPTIREETVNADGAVLFTKIFQDVTLIAPDAEAAEKVVLGFLNQLDRNQAYAQEIQDLAERTGGTDSGIPYCYQLLYRPARLDEKVLSFYGTEIGYTGGVHPNQVGMSANFDMVSGTLLSLSDILIDSDAATSLSKQITDILASNREAYQLYDGFDTIISERFSGSYDNWQHQTDWYFSAEGLCVFFSPYDLAPYVAGQILVEIPYHQLQDILREDFFPAELPLSSGTVSAMLAQDVDLDQYSQFAEAILHTDGERFLLFSDDLVTNVRLERGEWSGDGMTFTPTSTVFYAYTLCAGDAVMVQDQIPDVLPLLRLTYESAGKTVCQFIAQSGKDGSILLTDAP